MRVARINVYVPDDLAAAAREAGLNVSGLTQEAIRAALAVRRVDDWLEGVAGRPPAEVAPAAVAEALAAARDEFGHRA